jgi:Ca-activated chloride channel family protein
MRIIFLLLLSGIATQVSAQESATKKIQRGNDLYKQQQYQQAEAAYKEVAETEPASTTAQFNKANAIYRQDRNSEAIKTFEEVTVKANEVEVKGKAYYNKGVILSGQKRLEESIEAYKNALRQNPADKEARENLQKALLELKQKQPPPKKEEPKKQQEQKQKQQQQPKMNQKEAQQRLKLLEQKEKDVQQRLQNEKSKQGGGQPNDW